MNSLTKKTFYIHPSCPSKVNLLDPGVKKEKWLVQTWQEGQRTFVDSCCGSEPTWSTCASCHLCSWLNILLTESILFPFLFFFTATIVSPSKCENNVPWAHAVGATIAHMTFLINCRKQWLMKTSSRPPSPPACLPNGLHTLFLFHSSKPMRTDASFHLCALARGWIYHLQDTQGTSRAARLL